MLFDHQKGGLKPRKGLELWPPHRNFEDTRDLVVLAQCDMGCMDDLFPPCISVSIDVVSNFSIDQRNCTSHGGEAVASSSMALSLLLLGIPTVQDAR